MRPASDGGVGWGSDGGVSDGDFDNDAHQEIDADGADAGLSHSEIL